MGSQALPVEIASRLSAEGANKITHLPVFFLEGIWLQYSLSCSLKVQLLISLNFRADLDSPGSLKELVSTSSTFYVHLVSTAKPNVQGACLYFCSCHTRDGPSNHLALMTNELSIHESHRNILNREISHLVFKQLHEHFLKLSPPGSLQREKAKIPISQSLPAMDLLHAFSAAARGSGFS